MRPAQGRSYRPNVGLALFNDAGRVFLGRRVGGAKLDYAWQMPQGGIDSGESPRIAALRELEEEIGVPPALVELMEETSDWLTYDFPAEVLAKQSKKNKFIGQRQKWFALRFRGRDGDIRLDLRTPEFDDWRWARLEEAPALVVPFKRAAYEEVARRFARYARRADRE
ncbi:MAG: RNA pyrophosphohydrolase [Hyphomonadaceae bacterium]